MAPIGVEGEGGGGAELEAAGLLEVLEEEDSLGVGVEVVMPGRGVEVVIAAPDLNLAQWEDNQRDVGDPTCSRRHNEVGVRQCCSTWAVASGSCKAASSPSR